MSKENLERVQAEINVALEIANGADRAVNDPVDTSIDADTFQQIARRLRRALRLTEPKPAKPSRAEQEAETLFDFLARVEHGGYDGDADYEVLCVLDEYVNGAQRVYASKQFFIPMYAAARAEGSDSRVLAILRHIRKGTPPSDIGRMLAEGSLR